VPAYGFKTYGYGMGMGLMGMGLIRRCNMCVCVCTFLEVQVAAIGSEASVPVDEEVVGVRGVLYIIDKNSITVYRYNRNIGTEILA
jgi:hypothetical protein